MREAIIIPYPRVSQSSTQRNSSQVRVAERCSNSGLLRCFFATEYDGSEGGVMDQVTFVIVRAASAKSRRRNLATVDQEKGVLAILAIVL
ncbi:hypothetical protein WAI453_003578 [Rhynchosporium graminicola]